MFHSGQSAKKKARSYQSGFFMSVFSVACTTAKMICPVRPVFHHPGFDFLTLSPPGVILF